MHLDGKLYDLKIHNYDLLNGNSGIQLEEMLCLLHSTPLLVQADTWSKVKLCPKTDYFLSRYP